MELGNQYQSCGDSEVEHAKCCRNSKAGCAAPSDGRGATWLMAAGVVLLGLGLKWWLVWRCGSDLPQLDQWAAEGSSALHPWVRDVFNWRSLFWPHGEHHPAIARILSLGLFVWNGQWDCRVELAANGLLMAGYLAALACLAIRLVGDWRRPVALLGVLGLLGLPGIYENHLWGFQTAFIGVLAFGLLHLLGMAEDRGWCWWLAGGFAGVMALFTIASGFMSAVVLCGVALVRLRETPRNVRLWLTLLVNAALAYWGWRLLARSYATPGGRALDLGEFGVRLTVLLAWPLRFSLAAVLLQAPLFVCIVRTIHERGADRRRLLLSGVGLWCWALTVCLAVGRGNGFGAVAGRYWDVLATGLLANLLAGLLLWPEAKRARLGWGLLGVGWLGMLVPPLWELNSPNTMRWVHEVASGIDASNHEMITTYLRLGKFGPPGDGATHPNLPHPAFTRMILDDPLFQHYLPPSVVPPLAVVVDPSRSRGSDLRDLSGGREAVIRIDTRASGDCVLVSQPIMRCGRPLLQLGVRGLVGNGRAELYAEDSAGRRYDLLDAWVDSTDRFKTERIRCDAKTVRIIARVPTGQMLEFTEPVEIGWLSFYVPKLLRGWWVLVVAGGGAFVVGSVFWTRRANVYRSMACHPALIRAQATD